jgi:hypothetical protein
MKDGFDSNHKAQFSFLRRFHILITIDGVKKIMHRYQGIIHNHSACSKEGCYPLSTLRQRWATQFDFAAMTEHAERTDAQAYAAYLSECDALSDEQFRFIPGLEIETESGDMLLLGCRTYICTRDPLEVLQQAADCVILLAHPEEGKMMAEVLQQAHGFEVWNSGHMGGYMPPLDWLASWRRWITPGKIVTGGNDIHKVDPRRKIITSVQSPSTSEKHILEAIKQGNFVTSNGIFTCSPVGRVSYRNRDITRSTMCALCARSYRLGWRWMNNCLEVGATMLATLGIHKQKRTRLNRLIRQYF